MEIWPIPPDWTNGVTESLAWLSDVMQASATAVTQHRGLRPSPRRRFSFEVLAAGRARRVADMLLLGHGGFWWLPVWPDVCLLAEPLAAGADRIRYPTEGRDFAAGGRALLWTAIDAWEVVEIKTAGGISANYLMLAAPVLGNWPAGTRLYPLRRARLADEGAEETLLSEDISRRRLSFDLVEPCDWPAPAGPEYLGHPVLEMRPDESDDPTAGFSRLVQSLDDGVGMPLVYDLPDLALPSRQTHWMLHGRAAHTRFRSLLYTLQGRCAPLWLPSFAADLALASAVAGNGQTLSVEWSGYTRFGQGRPNRKDLRIELDDGTVFYRRVLASAESASNEVLTLDAALSASSIQPGRVRQISFMALSTLASDEVEIEHVTDADGLATCTLGWQAVVPDV
jgi:hypothetical protein